MLANSRAISRAIDYRAIAYELLRTCTDYLGSNCSFLHEGLPETSWFKNSGQNIGIGILNYNLQFSEGSYTIDFDCFCIAKDFIECNQEVANIISCLRCKAFNINAKSATRTNKGTIVGVFSFSINLI